MGVVQLRQIRSFLQAEFEPFIDLSDCVARSENDRQNVLLTRALAAFAIVLSAGVANEIAASSVIDGYNDNGVDAVYYSADDRTLHIAQSKWSTDGNGSIDQGSVEKFCRGINDLLATKFDHFNEKLTRRQKEIESAVNNTFRINIILVYSGSEKLGDHPRRVLTELLAELNDTGEVAYLSVVDQGGLHSSVSAGGHGEPVNVTVQLFDWGQTKNPYQAFYGQVAASDLAQWGTQYKQRIFSKNIRSFLGGSTTVNEGIAESIRRAPASFWYLNNGVTALCGSIKKRPIGGSSHEAGTFDCENVAIVNGAQTVGTITELGVSAKDQLASARVPIRLISLEGCPPEFANEVTRATNTQNRIDSRNFVALDSEQARLRSELLVDGIEYEYRQGEGEPMGDRRFGLVDATVALACSSNTPDLAVQAKREISKLWEDLSRPPYKLMFNPGLQGLRLWHLVQILRDIDDCLDLSRIFTDDARLRGVITNGNRTVAHIVFRSLDLSAIGALGFDADEHRDAINYLTAEVCRRVSQIIAENYEDAYLAHLFKNVTKCRDVVERVGVVKVDQEAVLKARREASELGAQMEAEVNAAMEAEIPF